MGFWDYTRWRKGESSKIPPRVESAAEDRRIPDRDLSIQEDRPILTRVDQKRFEEYVEEYYPKILRYCYNNIGDRYEAEDLTAETFLVAFQNCWKFNFKGGNFGAWIYRIATYRILKLLRDKRRHPHEALPENLLGEILLVSREPDPEKRLELTREVDRLMRYMEQLDPQDRVYLNLRYREGFSSQEISAIVGKKWGTIASRISRAKRKLQEMATEDDERSQ